MLMYATYPGFITSIVDRTVISTSTNVTGLVSRVTYYWRVNATNTYGTSVGWSKVWNFRTQK